MSTKRFACQLSVEYIHITTTFVLPTKTVVADKLATEGSVCALVLSVVFGGQSTKTTSPRDDRILHIYKMLPRRDLRLFSSEIHVCNCVPIGHVLGHQVRQRQ